ncbi:hypothetical protein TI05_04385 [Achromatium sp. WMS3]|nr:hypothetical protein TI05_04385 [Achromatium sp. WMS3]
MVYAFPRLVNHQPLVMLWEIKSYLLLSQQVNSKISKMLKLGKNSSHFLKLYVKVAVLIPAMVIKILEETLIDFAIKSRLVQVGNPTL